MIKFFSLSLLLCFAVNTNAANNSDFFNNETLDSCYGKAMSPAVQNCMIYLAGEKKKNMRKRFIYC